MTLFYILCLLLLVVFIIGFWFVSAISAKLGVVIFILFCLFILAMEFINLELNIIKKTYTLYLNGTINTINLSRVQSFIESILLKDIRKKVDEKRGC